jgi:hypothetical protein
VRLTTADGQKLQNSLPIHLRLAGAPAGSWTKSASPEHWEAASGDETADDGHSPPPAPTRHRDPAPPVAEKRGVEWSPYR